MDDELTNAQLRAIAARIRAYAAFLNAFAKRDGMVELGEFEWDFPIFTTAQEVHVHLEDIVDAVAERQ
jgi:hypothetical protein